MFIYSGSARLISFGIGNFKGISRDEHEYINSTGIWLFTSCTRVGFYFRTILRDMKN